MQFPSNRPPEEKNDPEDFRDHKGSDGKINTAESEYRGRNEQGKKPGDDAPHNDSPIIGQTIPGYDDHCVSCQTDECGLAEGDETGVSGKEVPHISQRKIDEEKEEI
jgi:hypothetical protein